jgi:hypothetical protein
MGGGGQNIYIHLKKKKNLKSLWLIKVRHFSKFRGNRKLPPAGFH